MEEKFERLVNGFNILFLLAIFPLTSLLPVELAFENHFIENAQVIILFLGALYCYFLARIEKKFAKLFRTGQALFTLLALREMSWGRIFFQDGVNEFGAPTFVQMSAFPLHALVNFLIGVYIISVLVALVVFVPWKNFLPPPKFFYACFLTLLLATAGERNWIYDFAPEGEMLEELAETLCYLNFIFLTIWAKIRLQTKKFKKSW